MKVFFSLLLAVGSLAAPAPEADPAIIIPYTAHHAVVAPVHTAVSYVAAVHTGNAVPVAVGGYKAEAGCNENLCGPVHEVPALVGALALEKQESAGAVKLTTGTGHLVATPIVSHYIGKRESEPVVPTPLVYGVHPYTGIVAGVVPNVISYAHHGVVPATHEVTYKTITPTFETNVVATNAAVPVAVGGYKAVAGDNGELKGAVHEVPAVFGAPALITQVNEASEGSLTVGTSAFITHTAGEPIVNEHTVKVPTYGVYGAHLLGKREAEADPYLLYGAYPYGGHYGHGVGYNHVYGYGHGYPHVFHG